MRYCLVKIRLQLLKLVDFLLGLIDSYLQNNIKEKGRIQWCSMKRLLVILFTLVLKQQSLFQRLKFQFLKLFE